MLDLANRHFPRVAVTAEDRVRTAMYRAEGGRRSLASSTGSLEDYYRSLEMRAEIGCADPASIPRIAQLTQKTNQFNITNRRYTEGEIRQFVASPNALVIWLRLRDRFSDDGIVGVMILRWSDIRSWTIDTFLMSCRIIGRTVENAFLGYVCQVGKRLGALELIGEYVPSKKNNLAANLYRDLGFEPIGSHQGAARWRLPLDEKPILVPEWVALEVVEEKTYA